MLIKIFTTHESALGGYRCHWCQLNVKPFSNLVSSLWLEMHLSAALPLFLEAAAPTMHSQPLTGNEIICKKSLIPTVLSSKAPQWESKHFLANSCKNALHLQAPKSDAGDNLAELASLPTVLLTLNNYLKLLERD